MELIKYDYIQNSFASFL